MGGASGQGRGQRSGAAPGGSPGRTPHPGSAGSTMNAVHVFFLKILGIQLWGQGQGAGWGAPVHSCGARRPLTPRPAPGPGLGDPSALLP